MITSMPTIGVRFDIEKVGGGGYGFACWKVFWQAITPEEIGVASLYEGDTTATLNRQENVFCIAIQSIDAAVTTRIKTALARSEAFKRIFADPMFIEGSTCTGESLPSAGKIDSEGNLVGDAETSRSALEALNKEGRTVTRTAEVTPVVVVSDSKPARKQTVEIEAETPEEAESLLAVKAPQGLKVIRKEVIRDGKPRTVTQRGRTTDEAIATILHGLSAGHSVLTKKVLEERQERTIEYQVDPRLSEETVRSNLPRDLRIDPAAEEVTAFVLTRPGGKRLFGILGYTPSKYKVDILRKALVELQFREKALIRATFGDEADYLIEEMKRDQTRTTECLNALDAIDPRRAENVALQIMQEQQSVWSKDARNFLNRRVKNSADEHVLCPNCYTYLGIRRSARRCIRCGVHLL